MSPSLYYVLAASLRSKKSSSTITFQGDDGPTIKSSKCSIHRTNRLERLKQFWLFATGATLRLMTGRTLGQPKKAIATASDSERSFTFQFPDPESEQHPPYIGSHPSATNPVIESTSGVEHFMVNVEPYFVRPTASAAEVLTNVAIQDMLAIEELDFYGLSCGPASDSTLSSVPEPSGSIDLVYPLASAESFGSSYSEHVNWSPRSSREGSPKVSPDPSEQYDALKLWSSRPLYINDTVQSTSSEVEVTFRYTFPDSPVGEDDDDDEEEEEVITIPVLPCKSSSFPHPHLLSTIPEGDEDEGGSPFSLDGTYDDEDDTSSVETIRYSRVSARAQPDIEFVWPSDCVERL